MISCGNLKCEHVRLSRDGFAIPRYGVFIGSTGTTRSANPQHLIQTSARCSYKASVEATSRVAEGPSSIPPQGSSHIVKGQGRKCLWYPMLYVRCTYASFMCLCDDAGRPAGNNLGVYRSVAVETKNAFNLVFRGGCARFVRTQNATTLTSGKFALGMRSLFSNGNKCSACEDSIN